jgi:hypothetical protein
MVMDEQAKSMGIKAGEWSVRRCPKPDLSIAPGDWGTLWLVSYDDGEFEGEIGIFLGKHAEAHARLFALSPRVAALLDDAPRPSVAGDHGEFLPRYMVWLDEAAEVLKSIQGED